MSHYDRFEADGLALLASARDVDSSAASLSLAQTLMRERSDGPPASDFSVLGADAATEYRHFATELADLLHHAPGYVFDIADNLRATARAYVTADAVPRANFTRIAGEL